MILIVINMSTLCCCVFNKFFEIYIVVSDPYAKKHKVLWQKKASPTLSYHTFISVKKFLNVNMAKMEHCCKVEISGNADTVTHSKV